MGRTGRGMAGMALMVAAALLSAPAPLAADGRPGEGTAAAVARQGGGLPGIMAAEHPGVVARSYLVGPWRYGCAYPGRGSTQATQFCTIQLENMTGTSMEGGFLLFTHATPDRVQEPLSGQPWEISLNLPMAQAFTRRAAPRLVVDQGMTIPLNVESCDSTGCLARRTFTAPQLAALMSGRTAQLVAETASGSLWSYDFSLVEIQSGIRQIGDWAQQGALNP